MSVIVELNGRIIMYTKGVFISLFRQTTLFLKELLQHSSKSKMKLIIYQEKD